MQTQIEKPSEEFELLNISEDKIIKLNVREFLNNLKKEFENYKNEDLK